MSHIDDLDYFVQNVNTTTIKKERCNNTKIAELNIIAIVDTHEGRNISLFPDIKSIPN